MIKRRDFLKIGGVVLATTGIAHPAIKSLATETVAARGRVLTKTALRDFPHEDGTVLKTLKPDSVQTILGYHDGWIQLTEGFVAAHHMQPMLDANHQPVEKLPAWAEVIAPYAAVRQWTQTEAPLMTRLGHGAVLHVDTRLDDAQGREWLRVDVPGWVQAEHLQPVQLQKARAGLTAIIDRAENVLLLEHGGREAARFAIARPEWLLPGDYQIETRRPGSQAEKSVAWQLVTDGGFSLHGTTTHNHLARITDGESVELSIIAAKMIYAALPENSKLTIR